MDEDTQPLALSQIANEAFNPVAPRQGSQSLGRALRAAGVPSSSAADPPRPARAPAWERDGRVGSGAPSGAAVPAAGGSHRRGKLFNDPVHGTFRLDAACIDVMDSRGFQRLRRLKQLGVSYYVFPGASHNRFEHSLGVAHLAFRFASHFWNLQRSELGMERADLRAVELAGLCHDLGHGPYSHVFDREFLPRRGVLGWEHEAMSAAVLDAIVEDNYVDSIPAQDLRTIKDMITAGHGAQLVGGGDGAITPGSSPAMVDSSPRPASASPKRWLHEIVANGRNGIDVDKFDYLARDSLCCGVRVSFDPGRIMQFSKVLDDEICYRYSEYMSLHDLFHSRASMHRQVYTHRKAKAVEYMVVDALCAADPVLKLSDRVWDARSFMALDDSVLDVLENRELYGWRAKRDARKVGWGRGDEDDVEREKNDREVGDAVAPSGSTASRHPLCSRALLESNQEDEAAVAEAQAVIARLRRRRLYRYCGEVLVPPGDVGSGRWSVPGSQDVVACYRGSGPRPRAEDVILHDNKISFSMRDSNPLDRVHFFDDLESTEKRALRPHQITSMLAANFQETSLRVYSRRDDPAAVLAVKEAFQNWVSQRFGGHVECSTPLKSRAPDATQRLKRGADGVRGSSPDPLSQRAHKNLKL